MLFYLSISYINQFTTIFYTLYLPAIHILVAEHHVRLLIYHYYLHITYSLIDSESRVYIEIGQMSHRNYYKTIIRKPAEYKYTALHLMRFHIHHNPLVSFCI